jgi:lipid-A-disaccharide synthase-like uncharacterized protein
MSDWTQVLQFFRDPMNVLGAIAQGLFATRFIVQWIASEIAGKSVIPIAFWYFSLIGGLALLSYAIYREEPVFIAGQLPGIIVYSRNLYFIHRDKRIGRNGTEVQVPGG